jgi:hypothetical protein
MAGREISRAAVDRLVRQAVFGEMGQPGLASSLSGPEERTEDALIDLLDAVGAVTAEMGRMLRERAAQEVRETNALPGLMHLLKGAVVPLGQVAGFLEQVSGVRASEWVAEAGRRVLFTGEDGGEV